MRTKLTKCSKPSEALSPDKLDKLRQFQQELKLPDEMAGALIQHRMAAHKVAKAKVKETCVGAAKPFVWPQSLLSAPVHQKILVLGTKMTAWVQRPFSEVSTQISPQFFKIPRLPSDLSPQTTAIALGVVGIGAIATVLPTVTQSLEKPTKITALSAELSPDLLKEGIQVGTWLLQANEYEKQRNWKATLATVIQLGNSETNSKWINRILAEHFKDMDQRYQKTVEAKGINKLRDDTLIAPANLPKNSSIISQIDAKAKSHRDEWNQNEKHLAEARRQANQWSFAGLTAAEKELDKIKLLGKKVKTDSPYWKQKIQPGKNLIASTRIALTTPKPSYTPSYSPPSYNPPSESYDPDPIPYSPPPSYTPSYSPPSYNPPSQPYVPPPPPSTP